MAPVRRVVQRNDRAFAVQRRLRQKLVRFWRNSEQNALLCSACVICIAVFALGVEGLTVGDGEREIVPQPAG